MLRELLLRTTALANHESIDFQLIKGEFANGNRYAIQYVQKEDYPKKRVLSRVSYSSKEKAVSVYESLIKLNDFNKRYK